MYISWILIIVYFDIKNTLQKVFFGLYSYIMSETYQPKKRKRAKTHGFLVRSKTAYGKRVLNKRRVKGRKKLTTV